MNTIAVYGRVASDVTTNNVNGRSVANFRFAAGNKRKQADGKYGTNFYNVAAWGSLGETAAKFLKKGYRASISGELVIRSYKGNDGLDHQAIEIDANTIDLVETKAESAEKSGASAQEAPAQNFTPVETPDDLPF
jgi:single-strand DNA-binding protein